MQNSRFLIFSVYSIFSMHWFLRQLDGVVGWRCVVSFRVHQLSMARLLEGLYQRSMGPHLEHQFLSKGFHLMHAGSVTQVCPCPSSRVRSALLSAISRCTLTASSSSPASPFAQHPIVLGLISWQHPSPVPTSLSASASFTRSVASSRSSLARLRLVLWVCSLHSFSTSFSRALSLFKKYCSAPLLLLPCHYSFCPCAKWLLQERHLPFFSCRVEDFVLLGSDHLVTLPDCTCDFSSKSCLRLKGARPFESKVESRWMFPPLVVHHLMPSNRSNSAFNIYRRVDPIFSWSPVRYSSQMSDIWCQQWRHTAVLNSFDFQGVPTIEGLPAACL